MFMFVCGLWVQKAVMQQHIKLSPMSGQAKLWPLHTGVPRVAQHMTTMPTKHTKCTVQQLLQDMSPDWAWWAIASRSLPVYILIKVDLWGRWKPRERREKTHHTATKQGPYIRYTADPVDSDVCAGWHLYRQSDPLMPTDRISVEP